jgi:hypothetical protein
LEEHVTDIFRVEALLAACFMLVSCLAYSSTVTVEAKYSSEIPVDFQRATWRYIPEERTLIVVIRAVFT